MNIGLGIDVLDFVLLLFSGRCCWISAGLGSCLDWFFLVAGLVVCVVALIAWFWMSLCSCTLLRISSF